MVADYDTAFSLDVRSLVDMTIQSLPLLIKSKGNMINLSTIGVTHRNYNLSMYIGAKSAVENFTRCWALDLAADGVRVNAIAPGPIRTDIWNVTNLSEEDAKEHKKCITCNNPMQWFGEPEEVANAALFLASDEAGFISGAVIAVNSLTVRFRQSLYRFSNSLRPCKGRVHRGEFLSSLASRYIKGRNQKRLRPFHCAEQAL